MLQTAKKIIRRKPATKIRTFKTPEAQADWSKHDRIADHLEEIARKADLIAFAIQGLMALEDNDQVWCMQDACYEIKGALEAIANEVRS